MMFQERHPYQKVIHGMTPKITSFISSSKSLDRAVIETTSQANNSENNTDVEDITTDLGNIAESLEENTMPSTSHENQNLSNVSRKGNC